MRANPQTKAGGCDVPLSKAGEKPFRRIPHTSHFLYYGGYQMLTAEYIKGIISSQKANFEIPDTRDLASFEIISLLNKLVKFANDIYVDDTTVSYGGIWYYTAPNLKSLDCIEIENIFQLYYVMDMKLYAESYLGGGYVITSDKYEDYVFAEIVSNDVYNEIYADIVTKQ